MGYLIVIVPEAAHFLNDVSWGAFVVITLLVIANEIVMRIKPLQLEGLEQQKEEK